MATEPPRVTRGLLAVAGATMGDIATAAFALCAVSGALLIPAYDAHDGRASIAQWLLTDAGAVYLRNVHDWTAQVVVIATLLHLVDHLRLGSERRLAGGVWLRVVLSLPVLGFLMLSGFTLRGDADAEQAQRVVTGVLNQLPVLGPLLATFLFGTGDRLHVVYAQHASVATIIVWLVIVEHARRLWPRATAVAAVTMGVSALSLVLSPGLHDGLDPRIKGPWYFLGLQEILHWATWPLVAVAIGVAGIALLWILPHLPAAWAERAKRGMLLALAGYALLCGIGLFLRSDQWRWQPDWPNGPGDLRPGWILSSAALAPTARHAKVPVVMGHAEGCLVCHAGVTGLGVSHQPEAIGCASCHGGNVHSLDARRAHAGMILVPGNLADASRTCGQAACHVTIIPRIERSIMTTFAGVIDVDRRVFGEQTPAASSPPHVRTLGASAADTHLRQLCASCHLGQTKAEWGAISESSRGGGCNACHLVYDSTATRQLAAYRATPLQKRTAVPQRHPALSIAIDNSHCFGCHSRSGRISTNYDGWHELREAPPAAALAADTARATRQYRLLDDGRYLTRVTPDVHQARGMDCIDCHTANEVMGKGDVVAHARDQVQIRCEDCHARRVPSMAPATADAESHKLMALRGWTLAPGQRLGATARGDALVNIVVNADSQARLRRKRSGEWSALRAPLAVCTQGAGHARLSCNSCHTPWAPRCASCHTSFDRAAEGFDHVGQKDVQGAWQESSGAFEATPPTLGIRTDSRDAAHPNGVVDTFVPGMILDLDRNRAADGKPDIVVRRLYARTFSHTISRAARSCESCHNDPVALGYGHGVLRYGIAGGRGRWSFTPAPGQPAADGLPADAWTGFLQLRSGMVSTRADVRPFDVEEQRRILGAGACLTCHAGTSAVMQRAITDFKATLARRSPRCVLPTW